MAERDNLPAKLAAQDLATTTEKRGSLVARGMAALSKDNDDLYWQATVLLGGDVSRNWNAVDNPAIFSAFKIFQYLASENYGKAYYPLSLLYCGKQDIEEGHDRSQHFAKLAFDWCFANQAKQDVKLWWYLGNMYEKGRGVSQDNEQAYYWYGKVIEQERLLDKFCKLGMACYDSRNYEQAMNWYRKAAELGHFLSQLFLAEMYEDGRGIQDDQQAVYWFRKALETVPGSGDAKGGLERLGIDWKK